MGKSQYQDGMLFTAEALEAADKLADKMTAGELRKWCSSNGIQRRRGARKRYTALLAYYQKPELVKQETGMEDLRPSTAVCSCGFEEKFKSDDEAKLAALKHKKANNTHFPKAWSPSGIRLYG